MKAKAYLELCLERDMKDNKQIIYVRINSKSKNRRSVVLLLGMGLGDEEHEKS